MTTPLLQADPQRVRLAAAALATTAVDASALVRQLGRAQPPCWQAPSRRDYTGQLTALGRRVDGVARSHDEAADVLTTYVAALDQAQERARYARSLAEEGRQRSEQWQAAAGTRAVGPDPGEALAHAAGRTLAAAEELERAAGADAARALRQLADRAPEQGWTSKTLRFVEDGVSSGVEGLAGLPGSVVRAVDTVWSLVPVVHGEQEQREARKALVEAAQVWEAWVDAARDASAGRPGLAAGVVAGSLWKPLTTAFPDPTRIKGRGKKEYLDGISEGVLTVDDLSEAWDQAHAAKALGDRIASLRTTPLPGIEALLAGDVDLAHHEARGGHTIEKHVGARIEALRERLRLETDGNAAASRSTFPDLATAQELVRHALAANPRTLQSLHDSPFARKKILRVPVDPVGTVLKQDGTIVPGREVVVIVVKEAGEVRVHTAYLEP